MLCTAPLGRLAYFCQNPAVHAADVAQEWLATTGSPHSKIERCEFSNERALAALEYRDFSTRRR
jgi:hypothetical protein